MTNLNCLMDRILYQTFKIILNIFFIIPGQKTDNPPMKRYVNKMENRIAFKIKTGYNLGLLTPETIKLLGSTENKITKDKIGESVPHLEIIEVILVHCNLVNNDFNKIQEYYIHFFLINHLVIKIFINKFYL